MIASKKIGLEVLGGRSLIGVDWLQFIQSEERNLEKGGTLVETSLRIVAQSRIGEGEVSFKPTSLSGSEIDYLLGLFNPVSTVPSPNISLSAANEFLLNVDKHNRDSSMAAALEDLRAKVRVALSIIQDDSFRHHSLVPPLRVPL